MKTTINQEGSKATLIFEGRLDTLSAPQTEAEVKTLMNDEVNSLLVDCSLLSYISSSGIRIMISLYKYFTAKGGEMTLKGLTDEVKEVFDMTGLLGIFKIVD